MALLAIGLNHRTAPIALRERLAFSPHQLPDILGHVKNESKAEEAVVLSTCNRTEIYLSATDSARVQKGLSQWLKVRAELPGLETYLYQYADAEAVNHLFRVAAGLDSMIIGEQEILAQVKQAYLTAHQAGFTAKLMNVLFQRSLYVGKRVRTETGLSLGSASIGSVAVAMAERIFGDLHDRCVMIMGAGKMAELTAKYLLSQKVRSIMVSNRTYERACELAKQFGGRALHFEEGLEQMVNADIVICSTAAPYPIISADQVNGLMQRRKGRSLFFVDIAVPRDVHPAVHQIDNVYVYNIDDLQSLVNENMARRSQDVHQAEAIIQEKAKEFSRWLQAYHAGQGHSLQHSPAAHFAVFPVKLRLGTRKSALAQVQARWVADQLRAAFPKLNVEFVLIMTSGDIRKDDDQDKREGGLKALFTKEIEEALLADRIDLAVHSLKDMASVLPKGLVIGAIPPREDPRDAWISRNRIPFASLPKGAKVGTGAVRRQAQLRHLRPDLELIPVRGNVDTRLRKLQESGLDGLLLALAGLKRLGRQTAVTEALTTDIMLPAVGQGFLAIEGREKNTVMGPFLKVLDDLPSRLAATAERAFLEALGGNCQTPIAAYAQTDRRELVISGLVASPDGVTVLRDKEAGPSKESAAIGRRLAEKLLAAGAAKILQ